VGREKIIGIYKIENLVNGKFYIGSSVDILKRWNHHSGDLNSNRHCNSYLQRAWNKYGEDNFSFEIIDIVEDKSVLFKREQYLLDTLNPFGDNGYNICKTTNSYTFGYKLSKERINEMKNRKFSNETKDRMSLNNPKRKRVIQLDYDGIVIKDWEGTRDISKNTSISVGAIRHALFRKHVTNGYIWVYEEDFNKAEFTLSIYQNSINSSGYKINVPVIQMDLEYNYLNKFNSLTEASNITNIDRTSIALVCNGKRNTAHNFKWISEIDYNEGILTKYKSGYKRLYQFDRYGNLIKEWGDVSSVCKTLGYDKSKISTSCNSDYYYPYNFIWSRENIISQKVILQNRIVQYDKSLNKINVWDNIKEVSKTLGFDYSSVYRCCIFKQKTSYGFKWFYEKDLKNIKFDDIDDSRRSSRLILVYNHDNILIDKCKTLRMASELTGINLNTVPWLIKYNKSKNGFHFGLER